MPNQLSSPNRDVTTGGWTTVPSGASLYQRIDGANPDDDSYIQSRDLEPDDGDNFTIGLSTVAPPVGTLVHTMKVRIKAEAANYSDMTVRLSQPGVGQIASWNVLNMVDEDWQTVSLTLSAAQIAKITNWQNLELEFSVATEDDD